MTFCEGGFRNASVLLANVIPTLFPPTRSELHLFLQSLGFS
jgi:hypothetical protein